MRDIETLLATRKDCFLWKNNTGALITSDRFIRYGKKGSADFLGLTRDGRFLAIECKTGNAVQTRHQKLFQMEVESMGGRYIVVYNWSEVLHFLNGLNL